MTKTLNKPGTDNLSGGSYREVGPRGGKVQNAREIRIAKGDRLPPTQEKGNRWVKE